jgi:CHAD domain-containing protein
MTDSQVLIADELSIAALTERVGNRLEFGPRATVRVTLLETFDWRLHDAGCMLTREREAGRRSLIWRARDQRRPYVLPVDSEVRVARDLPEGFLRDELAALIEMRALLPMAVARVRRQTARITDQRGNTAVRLMIEETAALDRSNRVVGERHRTVTVQPVAIRQPKLNHLLELLRNSGAGGESTIAPLIAATAARGRSPGDYSSKPQHALRPDQRSDEAVRAILGHLLDTATANVPGVLADIDVEFLHDLRVASRRARSALGQIKKVLPKPEVERLAEELEWLGSVTNRCRDLDVYLLELDGYRKQLGDDADAIDDLERLLRRERAKALRRVRSALRSRRFDALVVAWRTVLIAAPDGEEPANAARPIAELASRRILRAYRRMADRGSRLADPPLPEELHRLRIDAKKLRYLLEFFSTLYPKATITSLVKELKSFQDVLGGFNDMETQRTHLTEEAERLMAGGHTRALTVFAMGRLTDAMRARQDDYRRLFSDRFASFTSKTSRGMYSRTFGGD